MSVIHKKFFCMRYVIAGCLVVLMIAASLYHKTLGQLIRGEEDANLYRTYDQRIIIGTDGTAAIVTAAGKTVYLPTDATAFAPRQGEFIAELNRPAQTLSLIKIKNGEKTLLASHVSHAIWSSDGEYLYYFKETANDGRVVYGSYYVYDTTAKRSYLAASYVERDSFIISSLGKYFACVKKSDEGSFSVILQDIRGKVLFSHAGRFRQLPLSISEDGRLLLLLNPTSPAGNNNLQIEFCKTGGQDSESNYEKRKILTIALAAKELRKLEVSSNLSGNEYILKSDAEIWAYGANKLVRLSDRPDSSLLQTTENIIYSHHYEYGSVTFDLNVYKNKSLFPLLMQQNDDLLYYRKSGEQAFVEQLRPWAKAESDAMNRKENTDIASDRGLLVGEYGFLFYDCGEGGKDKTGIYYADYSSKARHPVIIGHKIAEWGFRLIDNTGSKLLAHDGSKGEKRLPDGAAGLGYARTLDNEFYIFYYRNGAFHRPISLGKKIKQGNGDFSFTADGRKLLYLSENNLLKEVSLPEVGNEEKELNSAVHNFPERTLAQDIAQFVSINAGKELFITACLPVTTPTESSNKAFIDKKTTATSRTLAETNVGTTRIQLIEAGKTTEILPSVYFPLNMFHFRWITS